MNFRTTLAACLLIAAPAVADDFPEPVNTQAPGEHPPSPEEMLDLFELPDGFNVTLFAGEPDVQQPIAFDFDDRGRIWVAENYTYSAHGEIDPNLRDRIIILEDQDWDGRHDVRKVFWDKGSMLTGLTWGFGGLWILNDGTLSFIPDRDGDDVPDSEPVEMLNGWTKNAGHNFVNGLLWGPDGWLYGRHGITDTSYPGTPDTPQEERQPINCGIWRFHPTKHTFEVVCHGTTNPWGLDYNEYGDFFMSNNVIGHLWHVIPGAHYERMFGQDFNPHLYELMGMCADHYHWDESGGWQNSRDGKAEDLGGGHSHSGLMIYYGQNFPEEYRGKAFMCNTHGRCINVDRLERKGSSYVAKHEPNFLKVNTPWFRGVELKYGPAGCVYLSDWSDNGECHDHDGVHRKSGRIYRISYGAGNAQRSIANRLGRNLDPQMVALPASRLLDGIGIGDQYVPIWHQRKYRRLLFERVYHFQSDHPDLNIATDEFWNELLRSSNERTDVLTDSPLELARTDEDEARSLELANLLCSCAALDAQTCRQLLLSRYESVRARTIQHVFDNPHLRAEVRQTFYGLLRVNTSPVVALAYASGLQRLPATSFERILDQEFRVQIRDHTADSWEIGFLLTARTDSAKMLPEDRPLRLMTWYAMLHHSLVGFDPRCPSEQLRAFATRLTVEKSDVSNPNDVVIALTLRNLVHRRATDDIPAIRSQLKAMLDGLRGRRNVALPVSWEASHKKLDSIGDEEINQLAARLSTVFGGPIGLDEIHELVSDRNGNHEARSRAVDTLSEVRRAESIPVLLSLVTDRAVYVDVARALAAFDDPRIPDELLKRWDGLRHGAQEAATDTLVSRRSYASEFTKAIADERVDSSVLTAAQVRQLLAFNDPEITHVVEQHWGIINDSSEAKAAAIESWKQKLTEESLAEADLENGAALFKKTCANCHKLYGEGEKIGPDLTGGNRSNMDYLLGNVIDPSAEVPRQFTTSVIVLKSGRVVTGVVIGETANAVTVQTDKEQMVIAVDDIEERTRTNKSLMPDGLLDSLTPEQVRDLIAFVRHRR